MEVGSPRLQLVWFKRDLRVHDHRPLVEAARRGPVLGLYVYEPDILSAPETDPAHVTYVSDCVVDLRRQLAALGGGLLVRRGSMPEVLDQLLGELPFGALWSHEETGLAVTWARDRRVKRWCRARGVPWHERPQHGVFRPHPERDGWAGRWEARMRTPPSGVPRRLGSPTVDRPGAIPSLDDLGLEPCARAHALQHAGREEAEATLESFLQRRGIDYRTAMSSPLEGAEACSRLSTHLAYGTLSLREVHHATEDRLHRVRALARGGRRPDDRARRWADSMQSFAKRLRWHCHFIQKLESQPALETESMSQELEGIRPVESEWKADDRRRFQAWATGNTGEPMVDACMRSLLATGWINFRMRAMLVSYATYQLWLDWRPVARHLAAAFLDFEPGIHYPQVQMQSGVTGINRLRIYSPAKQRAEQDPLALFVRRWIPELGKSYPPPIVDSASAAARARARLERARATDQARAESRRVYQRHGSRRRQPRRR